MPIILENISFSYGSTAILERIDLCVGDKERAFLIGPNGSGKTTLLKIVTGELLDITLASLKNLPIRSIHVTKTRLTTQLSGAQRNNNGQENLDFSLGHKNLAKLRGKGTTFTPY